MSKGYSDLFSGTKGDLLAKSQRTKAFQCNRSKEEYSSLARDPARGKKVDRKGTKERDIILDLERQGLIGKVIRDPQADKGADFIDTTTGQKWDIKSPVSHPKGHHSVRKGAFSVEKILLNVKKEISRENNVILDTRRLTIKDRQTLKDTIKTEGINNKIIWYDKKGGRE